MVNGQILSFKHAGEGILTALKEEPNLKVHFLIGVVVILAGIIFKITKFEWTVLLMLIGMVITLELTNTAIEEIVNTFTQEISPSAKRAKDVAAGAVLTVSITAAVIGMIIFWPYFQKLLI